MAEMIRWQEMPVEVDFHGLGLQDADDTDVPVRWPEGFEAHVFLSARPGRLDFGSAGHTHTAALTVEVWSAEPPVPAGEWEETASASIFCASGKLKAWGVAGGPMPEEVLLSDGPGNWWARAVCSGRAEVAELALYGVPEGVERYTVQFWPKA